MPENYPKVKESYVKKLLKMEKEHFKKYGYMPMDIEDLERLFRGK